MDTTMQMRHFIAVDDDGEGVLGKILYYSLSSIMVDRGDLTRICDEVGFPYTVGKRVSETDAFKSATGDIRDTKAVTNIGGGTAIFKVYCRDNASSVGVISRELVKETLGARTNDYKKLANICHYITAAGGSELHVGVLRV